jgi:hypothetical protein
VLRRRGSSSLATARVTNPAHPLPAHRHALPSMSRGAKTLHQRGLNHSHGRWNRQGFHNPLCATAFPRSPCSRFVTRYHAPGMHALPTPAIPNHLGQLSATPPNPTISWCEPHSTTQHDHHEHLGPDGEPWLPADPFHDYDSPTIFGPGTDGEPAGQPPTRSSSPASNTTTPQC